LATITYVIVEISICITAIAATAGTLVAWTKARHHGPVPRKRYRGFGNSTLVLARSGKLDAAAGLFIFLPSTYGLAEVPTCMTGDTSTLDNRRRDTWPAAPRRTTGDSAENGRRCLGTGEAHPGRCYAERM